MRHEDEPFPDEVWVIGVALVKLFRVGDLDVAAAWDVSVRNRLIAIREWCFGGISFAGVFSVGGVIMNGWDIKARVIAETRCAA